jgi:hypothetical protein
VYHLCGLLSRNFDHAVQLESQTADVAGFKALAKGHARPEALEDARKRLAQAQKAGA